GAIFYFFGFMGLVILYLKDKNTYLLLLTPIFIVFLFPIYLGATEERYSLMAFPPLYVGFTFSIYAIARKVLCKFDSKL
ncbi:MAG: hypothetical protein ACUVRD_07985, partial [Bacteroidia bacterium]